MLQAPGPRGSPHDPQALIGRSHAPADLAGVLDCAAKTDISFCSSAPLHDGQEGVWLVAGQILEAMTAAAAFVFEKRHGPNCTLWNADCGMRI